MRARGASPRRSRGWSRGCAGARPAVPALRRFLRLSWLSDGRARVPNPPGRSGDAFGLTHRVVLQICEVGRSACRCSDANDQRCHELQAPHTLSDRDLFMCRLRPSPRRRSAAAPAPACRAIRSRSRRSTRNVRSIIASVSWLQRQPSANAAHGPASRSCQRERRFEPERTCSQKSSRPPGRSTRRISSSAASGSGTVQSTSVVTTVSTEPVAAGSASAPARSTRPRTPLRRSRDSSRRAIGPAGSVEDELVEPVGIERQVEPGPGADLEHAPARSPEQCAGVARACRDVRPARGRGRRPWRRTATRGHRASSARSSCCAGSVLRGRCSSPASGWVGC